MVLRLKPFKFNKLRDETIFLGREWISAAIFFALVVVGYRFSSKVFLLAAAAFMVLTILRSDTPNAFCWSLFLVPNIRVFDDLGVGFLVNIILALPIVVYFIRQGTRRIPAVAVLGSVILLLMEVIHYAALEQMDSLPRTLGWALNVFLCIAVTVDSRVKLKAEDVFSALSTGAILSAAMYLASGQDTIMNIIDSLGNNARFEAFANDPNYYSLYICLSIACVLNVKGYNIYKFVAMALMTGIGFLTASKMCLLLMAFEYVVLFLQIFSRRKENRANKKFIVWSAVGMGGLLFTFRNYVFIFVDNFLKRAGVVGNQITDMDKLTSGRSGIMTEYLQILLDNVWCLLVGYGFSYHEHLGQSDKAGAHNTYLDMLLAWGVIGTAIFLCVVYLWLRAYRASRKINRISTVKLIPTVILLINLFDLSCLSAGMFPFVLAVAFIQWLPDDKEVVQNA